jgi:hypothetical protein
VIIKVGDRTHPHAVEVEFTYPDWAERNEELLKALTEHMNVRSNAESMPRDRSCNMYVV